MPKRRIFDDAGNVVEEDNEVLSETDIVLRVRLCGPEAGHDTASTTTTGETGNTTIDDDR